MRNWNRAFSGVNTLSSALEKKSIKSLKKSNPDRDLLSPLKKVYDLKKREVLRRLEEFKEVWVKGRDEEIFEELAFCIFTPQSKARVCFNAINRLKETGLLLRGSDKEITDKINDVRFKNKKAAYLVKARNFFTKNKKICIKSIISQFKDIYECREWLVKNITGLGHKEASHFLRNIGFGEDIAILDRHILKNLKNLKVIHEIPGALSRAQYLDIEKKMAAFSKHVHIPISHLDLVLWYKETGEILK
jgi:N-glycosylase/DNA lyase